MSYALERLAPPDWEHPADRRIRLNVKVVEQDRLGGTLTDTAFPGLRMTILFLNEGPASLEFNTRDPVWNFFSFYGEVSPKGIAQGNFHWAESPDADFDRGIGVRQAHWRRIGALPCLPPIDRLETEMRDQGGIAGTLPPPPSRTSREALREPGAFAQEPLLQETGYAPYGRIGEKYAVLGGSSSALGAASSSESDAPHGGRCHQFSRGSICWHPEIGEAFGVWGLIAEKWSQLGGVQFGYPITDETATPDGRGRFNHFRGIHLPDKPEASIYWTPETGAHAIYGAIREAWAQQGWEQGALGYPTSDEYQDGISRRVDFERGHISWAPGAGIRISNQ